MMVLVLGTGRAHCKTLLENIETAIGALGIPAEIEKVEAIEDNRKYGARSLLTAK